MTAVNIPTTEGFGRAVERVEVPAPDWPAFLRTADASARAALGAQLDRLQERLRVKDGILSVLHRSLRPGLSLAETEALREPVSEALDYSDDAARLALASLAAGLATAEVEDYAGAVE